MNTSNNPPTVITTGPAIWQIFNEECSPGTVKIEPIVIQIREDKVINFKMLLKEDRCTISAVGS